MSLANNFEKTCHCYQMVPHLDHITLHKRGSYVKLLNNEKSLPEAKVTSRSRWLCQPTITSKQYPLPTGHCQGPRLASAPSTLYNPQTQVPLLQAILSLVTF